MLNFEEDFTPAAKPAQVPAFLRKESAPAAADDAPAQARRVNAADKRIINGTTDVNQLVPFKYKWAW
ncbi:MAG: ribonucleotide-diphosphate reductase subunit beta, partial [Gammaproteobacteria bacterium]